MPEQADSHPGAGRSQLRSRRAGGGHRWKRGKGSSMSWRNSSRWRLSAVCSLTSLPMRC